VINHINRDHSIWKISWDHTRNGKKNRMRWIKKIKKEKWNPISEEKLKKISTDYVTANDNITFWIQQDMMVTDWYMEEIVNKHKDIVISLEKALEMKLLDKYDDKYIITDDVCCAYYSIRSKYKEAKKFEEFENNEFASMINQILNNDQFIDLIRNIV